MALEPLLAVAQTLAPSAPAPRESGADAARDSSREVRPPTRYEQNFSQVMDLLLKEHIENVSREMLYRAAIEGMLEHVSPELRDASPERVKASTRDSGKDSTKESGKDKSSKDRSSKDKTSKDKSGKDKASKEKKSERPSNALLEISERQMLERHLQGNFLGVGLWFEPRQAGYMEVVRVMRGSPAEAAGMRAGDRIIAVDGRPVGMTPDESSETKARPAAGSKVQFTVMRGVDRQEFSIVRREFPIEAVRGTLLPPDIGLLSFEFLSLKAPAQARQILMELKSRKVRGLLLDLRGSYGLDPEAIRQLAELFLPRRSPVLQVEKRNGDRTVLVTQLEPVISVPLAILINGQTSAGAEALAAALMETLNVVTVGESSAGKSAVEELFPLEGGTAALLSTRQLFSPSGKSWRGIGLLPAFSASATQEELEAAERAITVEEKLRFDHPLRTAVHLLAR